MEIKVDATINIAFRATDRYTLITFADGFIASNSVDTESPDFTYMQVSLACGCSKSYKTKEDVPFKSDKCRHGNYFIKYD